METNTNSTTFCWTFNVSICESCVVLKQRTAPQTSSRAAQHRAALPVSVVMGGTGRPSPPCSVLPRFPAVLVLQSETKTARVWTAPVSDFFWPGDMQPLLEHARASLIARALESETSAGTQGSTNAVRPRETAPPRTEREDIKSNTTETALVAWPEAPAARLGQRSRIRRVCCAPGAG